MTEQLVAIREQQRESWNNFSPGWRKWDNLTMDFLKPMGDEIIRMINPKSNELVLDVAGGTGEPGLTIATILTDGKVIITDLAEKMLDIARDNAARRGIKNIETQSCDVCELPFDDNTFDAISCRKGFMFFPDMLLAAREMVRVLKPGGRIAASVWAGPESNFWITAIMGTIKRHIEMTPPPPGAPGMFRCAKDGMMIELFSQAGLKNVYQNYVPGRLNSRSTDVYWEMMTEIGAPIVSALNNADHQTKEMIKNEVYQIVNEKYPDGNVIMDSGSYVVYGEKEN